MLGRGAAVESGAHFMRVLKIKKRKQLSLNKLVRIGQRCTRGGLLSGHAFPPNDLSLIFEEKFLNERKKNTHTHTHTHTHTQSFIAGISITVLYTPSFTES
jgi:hypothetical protein